MKKLLFILSVVCAAVFVPACVHPAGTKKKETSMVRMVHAVRYFPASSDRKNWNKVQTRKSVQAFRKKIMTNAERLLGKDIPELPAARYMDFHRNGERRPWEAYYFARRVDMEILVLAECFEHKGRFMDEIVNRIWAILNEPTWCVSAHAGLSPQDPLPDFEIEQVDLFSAETSARLSMVLQLMEKELNAVSPTLVKRMKRVIMERAIVSVEKKLNDFWWNAGANNWTPWICSNLLVTANTVLADEPKRLTAYVNLLQPCMNRYYARFFDDGACEEGSSYWGQSTGRAMLYYLQLHSMTDGKKSIFKEQKYRKMCEFISDNWFSKKYFVTFADCSSAITSQPVGSISKTADMLNSESLKNFGRAYRKQCPLALNTHDTLTVVLASLFWEDDLPAQPRKDFAAYYDKLQLLLIRSGRMHIAALGGRNAGGHHHLDVGHFIIAVDGQEQILDLGNTTYTRFTFSPQRFDNPVLNSLYHNVPVFDGTSQGNGATFAAKDVSYTQNGDRYIFSMDLASAYPSGQGIRKCIRTFVFDAKTKTLEVTDDWTARKAVSYSVTLFTKVKFGKGVIDLKSTASGHKSESFTVTDSQQVSNWGKQLWKTTLSLPKAKSGKHTMIFTLNKK